MAERSLAGSGVTLPSRDLASEVARRRLTMATREETQPSSSGDEAGGPGPPPDPAEPPVPPAPPPSPAEDPKAS